MKFKKKRVLKYKFISLIFMLIFLEIENISFEYVSLLLFDCLLKKDFEYFELAQLH